MVRKGQIEAGAGGFIPDSAVANLSGRRHGRVRVVVRKKNRENEGLYRVLWLDNGEETIEQGEHLLARYTTQSAKYNGVDKPQRAV